MLTDIYSFVSNLLGYVPIELDFLYPICTMIFVFVLFLIFITPFLILFYFMKR